MNEAVIHYRFLPRLVLLRDAPFYLGMDRNRCISEVRLCLTEIPIGEQGIAFDRLELDAWADHYKSCNGRPGQPREGHSWDAKERQASINAVESGTSTRSFLDSELPNLLEQATSTKCRTISPIASRRSAKQRFTE
jgi:hypothetical protein